MDDKSKLKSAHQKHREENWSTTNWRSWGSWFSWGSPVGLGLFYTLVIIPTGVFIWLIHHK
jgi:hypothetical protein